MFGSLDMLLVFSSDDVVIFVLLRLVTLSISQC